MNKMMYQLKERTFVNHSRTEIYPEGHPAAAHLLGPAGYLIPREYAVELGLLEVQDDSVGSGEDNQNGTAEGVEPDAAVSEGESSNGNEGQPDEGANGSGEQDEKAAQPYEDKSLAPQENKGQNPFSHIKDRHPIGSTQYNTTMTVLNNAGVDPEQLPNMLDADLLDIDGISRNRLELIRAHFPAEESNGDTVDS